MMPITYTPLDWPSSHLLMNANVWHPGEGWKRFMIQSDYIYVPLQFQLYFAYLFRRMGKNSVEDHQLLKVRFLHPHYFYHSWLTNWSKRNRFNRPNRAHLNLKNINPLGLWMDLLSFYSVRDGWTGEKGMSERKLFTLGLTQWNEVGCDLSLSVILHFVIDIW